MVGLDTNVIVRYIMQDDPVQVAQAVAVIEDRLTRDNPGFIGLIVLVETIWVLKTVYHIPKPGLLTVIDSLLTTRQLLIEQSELVFRALKTYRAGNGDFSDSLIAAIATAQGCNETLTFDRKATNVGMRLITPLKH
jgi:predicted nucleic-acid-binding protein